MTTQRRLLTVGEYTLLPDDGFRHELVDGVLSTMPPASMRHGEVAATIARHIGNFVAPLKLARVSTNDPNIIVQRGPDTVLAPDIAVVLSARVPAAGLPSRPAALVPDLVVEIRSPSDRPAEIADKTRRWLAAGVQIVWNVDIELQTVEVARPGHEPRLVHAGDTLDAEPVLPGFSVPVAEVFA